MGCPHARGRWGEELAALYLAGCGYRILARRFRRGGGEIDLVARRGDSLVFVEVKTRSQGGLGVPAAAVDGRKLGRLRRVARAWLAEYGWQGAAAGRFDVVSIIWRGDGRGCELNHLHDVTS